LAASLKANGIPTATYYASPVHRQPPYAHFPVAGNGLPNTEAAAQTVLSLPMHPYLETDIQDRIVGCISSALEKSRIRA
jgi:dTDP-4-amino-4,6-dideoxygalactose transaminase